MHRLYLIMMRKKDRTCIAIHGEIKAVFERRDATSTERIKNTRVLARFTLNMVLLGKLRWKLALICLDKLSHYSKKLPTVVIYHSLKPCCIRKSTILYIDRLKWRSISGQLAYSLMVKFLYRSAGQALYLCLPLVIGVAGLYRRGGG